LRSAAAAFAGNGSKLAELVLHLPDPRESVGIQTIGGGQGHQDHQRRFKMASDVLWIEAG
jgi:hypothetical protein